MAYRDRNGTIIKSRDTVRVFTYPGGYEPGDPGVGGHEAMVLGPSSELASGRGHWVHVEFGSMVKTYPSFCLELVEEHGESRKSGSESSGPEEAS